MATNREVGLVGEVSAALCDCHAGKWWVTVFYIHPQYGRIPVGQVHFESEASANENVKSTIMALATEFLDSVGLSIDEAQRVVVLEGELAGAKERSIYHQSNPNLH